MPAAKTEIIIRMNRGFRLHSAQLIFLTELEANAVSPRKQTEPSPGTARLNTSQQRGQGRIGHVSMRIFIIFPWSMEERFPS